MVSTPFLDDLEAPRKTQSRRERRGYAEILGTKLTVSRGNVIMSPLTIVLRFTFGIVLASVLIVPLGLGFVGSIILVLGVGTVAALWGDKFIVGFMSVMRYLR